jgi:hypothetical protein
VGRVPRVGTSTGLHGIPATLQTPSASRLGIPAPVLSNMRCSIVKLPYRRSIGEANTLGRDDMLLKPASLGGQADLVEFWHGSRVYLPVGTHLTSLRYREGDRLSSVQFEHMANNAFDTDRVYFTTDRELARAWCARDVAGAVFQVEPVGPYEPDPDYPNTSFSAATAVVLEVDAAYDPESYDERGFIRPEVRLPDMFTATGRDGLAFRRLGGRYPNPMRFLFRLGRLRYMTDDNEFLLAHKLAEFGISFTEAGYQAELAHARALPLASEPVRWL